MYTYCKYVIIIAEIEISVLFRFKTCRWFVQWHWRRRWWWWYIQTNVVSYCCSESRASC